MAQNVVTLGTKYFVRDLLGGIIYFPFWWYTGGLWMMLHWTFHSIRYVDAWLGFSVWLRNIFVPMYGETQLSGRAISFLARLMVIVVRGIAVLVWSIIALAIFSAYLLLLPAAVLGIFFNGGGLVF